MKILSKPYLLLVTLFLLILVVAAGSYLVFFKTSSTVKQIQESNFNVAPKIASVSSSNTASESSSPAVPVISQSVTSAEAKSPAPSAPAKNIYQGSDIGFDFSYPQCATGFQGNVTTFGIVGVTGGKAFKKNPCLLVEYNWAKPGKIAPSFYMNINFPVGSTVDKGLTGPAGSCLDQDIACQAYNYGWNSAQDAKAYADSLWVSAPVWWLDIEVYNTWLANTSLNEKVINGAIDYFHNKSLTVGIYSSPKQWYQIVSYSYAPKVPVWISGAANKDGVASFCQVSLGGGTVWLSQYSDGTYDYNISCNP